MEKQTEKYHLRVSVDRETGKKLAKEYISKWSVKKYAFAFEQVGDNVHIHGHIEYTNEKPSKQILSQWMKQWNPNKKKSFYYHKHLVKEEIHNMAYVTKDKDILLTNFTKEELAKCREVQERIEDEKKTPMKQQLVKYCSDKITDNMTLSEVYKLILEYHIERDYLPNANLIKSYVLYVCIKLDRCKAHLKDYIENTMF